MELGATPFVIGWMVLCLAIALVHWGSRFTKRSGRMGPRENAPRTEL